VYSPLLPSPKTITSSPVFAVDEWAKAANTINYEIITRIGPRVPRIYPRE